jgi:hypothetical protein
MVMAVCQRCEENFEPASDASIIEVDERDLAAIRRIFEGLKEPMICAACGCDSGAEPTILLHTNRGAAAWVVQGGRGLAMTVTRKSKTGRARARSVSSPIWRK